MLRKRPSTSKHVVGVDGGEDEVAGERGVDGDMRSFLVSDFADEDLVRIVAQNSAQAAGEGETLFLVDRNLGDALELIFDRIFDRDDLVFVVLISLSDGVERRGLTRAGRTRDQHHPVRLFDVAAELGDVASRRSPQLRAKGE